MTNPSPTTDQLRSDVDQGKTGEKVNWPDPAAAPLGTDAEAGGAPPTRKERDLAARTAKGPAHQSHDKGVIIYPALAACAAILMVCAVVLAG